MKNELRKAAVLGAGTMGSRIAAHLANAGVDCLLLDLPAPDAQGQARNAVVQKSLKNLGRSRPPAYFSQSVAKHLRAGNFEDDFERIGDADWIIEAVIEKMDVKRDLLAKVDRFRRPGSLVSSNTSGLPIAKLAEGFSDDFRRHWLGTHFFNPPRHMRLMELIPTPETDPAVIEWMTDFCDRRLGKVVVRANDRPNFIANRIFLFSMMHALRTMLEQGLTVEQVDALTGPLIGRPRMATFRLADFTGIDVCVYVAGNLFDLVPEDERREVYQPPDFLRRMVKTGIVGDKAGQGFYKKDREAAGGRLVLDLESLQYREIEPPEWPSVSAAKGLPDVVERIRTVIDGDDAAAKFLWTTLSELFLYAAARIPEVCDDIVTMDDTMKAGFNWQKGIFEIWDGLGVEGICERMKADGKDLPPLVEATLASQDKSFYGEREGRRTYFDVEQNQMNAVPERPGVLKIAELRAVGAPFESNPGASLWDMGDGVALLEFHSKANSLDQNVLMMLERALTVTEERFDALVIGNDGANFSVGANLQMILGLIVQGKFAELEGQVAELQQLLRRIRFSPKPVVSAVFGQTLGGGCEIALRSDRVQAAGETYMGLVEVGVGLIPAAGGSTEMVRRHTEVLDSKNDVSKPTRFVFETLGGAKVANSALEAREWKFLRIYDDVTMNRDRLLGEAKKEALGLVTAGYDRPEETEILVGGKGTKASLDLAIWMMRQAGYISDYDAVIGDKLANVLSGGLLSQPSYVSEEYMLGLEREAFMSLCGEERTHQRMEHLLKTGKPLRN